jgi:hypothetical protein
MDVLLKIEGNRSCVRAKPAHFVGHLPSATFDSPNVWKNDISGHLPSVQEPLCERKAHVMRNEMTASKQREA